MVVSLEIGNNSDSMTIVFLTLTFMLTINIGPAFQC